MRLTDGTHAYVIIGEHGYIKIIRGPLALGQACDHIAQLRIRREGSFRIMEPRFCEKGCCILDDWLPYTLSESKLEAMGLKKCYAIRRRPSLI